MIELLDITTLDRGTRDATAAQLVEARYAYREIEFELPIPAHGYASEGRARDRLKRIARNVRAHNLSAFAIMSSDEGEEAKAIGMATAQVAVPSPNRLEHTDHGVEFSYWLGGTNSPLLDGVEVIGQLMQVAPEVPGAIGSAALWSVTLPRDIIKQAAYASMDMQPVGRPEIFDLGDNVREPRQLWAAATNVAATAAAIAPPRIPGAPNA